MTGEAPKFDFTITAHRGNVCLLYPWSVKADKWIADQQVNCGFSSWGNGVAIECHKMPIVVEHLQENGYIIEGLERDEWTT